MIEIQRRDVVTCARTYIGTPFHHQARLKGVGIDCAGLIICVAKELDIVPVTFDVTSYPQTPDGTSLIHLADMHMKRNRLDAPLQLGDVIVVRFTNDPQHLGIIGDYWHGEGILTIIHASGAAGRVIEDRLMFSPSMGFVASFTMPGVV